MPGSPGRVWDGIGTADTMDLAPVVCAETSHSLLASSCNSPSSNTHRTYLSKKKRDPIALEKERRVKTTAQQKQMKSMHF